MDKSSSEWLPYGHIHISHAPGTQKDFMYTYLVYLLCAQDQLRFASMMATCVLSWLVCTSCTSKFRKPFRVLCVCRSILSLVYLATNSSCLKAHNSNLRHDTVISLKLHTPTPCMFALHNSSKFWESRKPFHSSVLCVGRGILGYSPTTQAPWQCTKLRTSSHGLHCTSKFWEFRKPFHKSVLCVGRGIMY